MTDISDRLRSIRAVLKRDQQGISELLGLGKGTWQRLELEGRLPKSEAIAKLVELGFSPDWLLTGAGEVRREDPLLTKRLGEIRALLDAEAVTPLPAHELEKRPSLASLRDELREIGHDESAPSRNRHLALFFLSEVFGDEAARGIVEESDERFLAGFSFGARSNVAPRMPPNLAFLPRYDVQAGAGGGIVVNSEEIVDHVAFDTSWLRQTLNIDPKRAALITAVGDSMYPTIADGDILIVDLSIDRVLDNAIYALRFGESLSVKRVQLRPTGGLRIISDNTKYEPDELGPEGVHDLHVVGRVIWHGGVM